MGNRIGLILISYDINSLHNEVKEKMEILGYFDNWKLGAGPLHQMPNTTLWHKSKSSDAAIRDIQNVCNQMGVTLGKGVAVLADDFAGA